jgi:hypothetical protein
MSIVDRGERPAARAARGERETTVAKGSRR